MKTITLLGLGVLILCGVALVIYGGYDDSPGAQGLGLTLVGIGLWRGYRVLKIR